MITLPFIMGKSVVKHEKKAFKSSLVRTRKALKSSWDGKMKIKQEKQLIKRIEDEKKDAIKQASEEKRKRREENKRRRQENAKKAEVVQVIKNPVKLKRMKKKELKRLRKVE